MIVVVVIIIIIIIAASIKHIRELFVHHNLQILIRFILSVIYVECEWHIW